MIEFAVLGSIRVGAVAVGGRMQRMLLAVLLARANETVSVSELSEHLWPGERHERADQRLHLHVHRLRRILGDPGRLAHVDDGYRLRVRPGELDAERFDEFVRRAEDSPEECVGLVDAALALWRGEPFGGLDGPAVADAAARLTERRLFATELRYAAELRRGRHAAVVAELTDAVARHPLRERPAELLMTALYRSGRQAEALAVYRRIRRVLVDELGVEPGARLRLLERRVLAGDPIESDGPAAAAVRPDHPVPAQLPHDVGAFTGRTAELSELDGVEPPAVVVISGTAGVGKTSLAVRWGHRAQDRFPDGQLHVDLRGYGPDDAVPPHDALGGFLRALGVEGSDVPTVTAERAALFRTLLAGRRVLVVIDNARSADQVRPLLPGSRSGVTIVTSRDALTGLVVREGARRLHLDRMPTPEAVALFREMAGAAGSPATDAGAVATVVERCARLPLALRVAAEQLSSRPGMDVTRLAAEFTEDDRLDALDLDDPHTAVRSVFSWSYTNAEPQAARLFRLYGLHPGHDLGPPAMAAMADLDLPATRRAIGSLVRAGMIERDADDRVSPHDLMREYARERALADEPPDERDAALRRLSSWYLHTAVTARRVVDPGLGPIALTGPPPSTVPAFADRGDALRWFEVERPNLVAVVRHAADGEPALAWRLAGSLLAYFYLSKHWDDWLTTHRLGLAAARACDDPFGSARMLNGLGVAYSDLGRSREAVAAHEEADALHRVAGDPSGKAWNLNNLGVVYVETGRFAEALERYERALALFTTLGNDRGRGLVLYNIGDLHLQAGDPGRAAALIRQALRVQEQAGDLEGQRFALRGLGDLAGGSGRHAEARACYRRALDISRELGDRLHTAELLDRLAQAEDTLGNHRVATAHADEAAGIAAALVPPVHAPEPAGGGPDESGPPGALPGATGSSPVHRARDTAARARAATTAVVRRDSIAG
ncbi:AfsR/SARP family transcriptional regulator [Myceligenerans pegani]|uniref:Tetratricopeptide repeat protein n=1 Tax=Myceligenerans pegani TaxID=2776917 RepID=A0ABR9N029_9MICO|nr:BTAD domain-containing putative transcriptional regulator [Myceligenerans sp. TRM 65318]MBE1877004.1 tetratricopeptide repeat protein [Myceligenerans sp. TRM 65318]MBE3019275.1 tetratricopeptide repeat protein [Myceligenerans sp. TRM 65318]